MLVGGHWSQTFFEILEVEVAPFVPEAETALAVMMVDVGLGTLI